MDKSLEVQLKEKVRHYSDLTNSALNKVKILAKPGTAENKIAEDYLSMASNYSNDAKFFEENGELLNALAAYSYAHAWLDAGVRAKLLDGKKDDRLFTLP